jgi:hypothetical protein
MFVVTEENHESFDMAELILGPHEWESPNLFHITNCGHCTVLSFIHRDVASSPVFTIGIPTSQCESLDLYSLTFTCGDTASPVYRGSSKRAICM